MGTGTFEEIEHTADWAICVRASELGSLFSLAAEGMFSLIECSHQGNIEIHRPITLQASDLESLLVSWLEELLYILAMEQQVLVSCNVSIPSETQLLATASFLPVLAQGKEIKAVTFNELKISETDEGFEVTIVFDV